MRENNRKIVKLYPGGRKKAFNVTYDDGVTQDVRFIELLNKYNLKGTFNLNSSLMELEFCWTHESGLVIKRLSTQEVIGLYDNHEIASHTLTHPYMNDKTESEIMHELAQDKENLERIFGREISGFAVPFDYYSDLIAKCAERCGFHYARMSEESYTYVPPTRYFYWTPGAFHISSGFKAYVDGFFETDEELALCQIVGHSYDLDTDNLWEYMESLFERISKDADIVSMTNISIVKYLKAIRSVDTSGAVIKNDTEMDLWYEIDGHVKCLKPGEEI